MFPPNRLLLLGEPRLQRKQTFSVIQAYRMVFAPLRLELYPTDRRTDIRIDNGKNNTLSLTCGGVFILHTERNK